MRYQNIKCRKIYRNKDTKIYRALSIINGLQEYKENKAKIRMTGLNLLKNESRAS